MAGVKVSAVIDACIDFGRFENIELFERGFYAVRARVRLETGGEVGSGCVEFAYALTLISSHLCVARVCGCTYGSIHILA